MKFISPLKVWASRARQFILNLNGYRNTHYRTLNSCKVNYKEHMREQILKASRYTKVICVYTVYNKSRHRFDLGNVCSIHQKFFEDAFVELGRLEDDTVEFIPLVIYKKGRLDKDNPRVEIDVFPFNKEGVKEVYSIIDKIVEEEMID